MTFIEYMDSLADKVAAIPNGYENLARNFQAGKVPEKFRNSAETILMLHLMELSEKQADGEQVPEWALPFLAS